MKSKVDLSVFGRYSLVLLLFFATISCDQKEVLLKNGWFIIDGKYQGQRIEFNTLARVKLIYKQGSERIDFYQDGNIDLPGIQSPSISAKWIINGSHVKFDVDSSKYVAIGEDELSSLASGNFKAMNRNSRALYIKETIGEVWKIYEETFTYSISRDTLILQSNKTRIRAVRDRTSEDLLKVIKP